MSFKYQKFYEDHISLGSVRREEVSVNCIFHDDTSPSLCINLETGLWKCQSPGCETNQDGKTGGNAYTFYTYLHKEDGMAYDDAVKKVNELYGAGGSTKPSLPKLSSKFPISPEEIISKNQYLLSSEKVMKIVTEKFHWSEEVIVKFNIGFDPSGKRIWIPITEHGKVVNIRKYSRADKENKIISVPNFGQARLWPLEALDQETVYLFEGEKDCILAHSLGLNGITVTGGAGTFNVAWVKLFDNRKVVVCYDIDEAGRKGAEAVAHYLLRSASEVKVIELPISSPANADFTDYICQGNSREDFLGLVSNTDPLKPINDTRVPDEVIEISISQAVEKKLFFRRIKSRIRVVSKMETPLLLPGTLHFTCTRSSGKMCYGCDNHATGEASIDLDERTNATLRLLTSSMKENKNLYREFFRIPSRCACYQVLETDYQYVEDILSSPLVEEYNRRNMFRQRFEEHQMFILNTALDVNTDYNIESVMYEHPVDRKIVHLVYSISPCLSTLDNSRLKVEDLKALEVFNECGVDTSEVGADP